MRSREKRARASQAERLWLHPAWAELEELGLLSGVHVQAFDALGQPFHPRRTLPPLCALLARSAVGREACAKDCLRKVALYGDTRAVVPARCYAGLSYRIATVARPGQPAVVFQVGRVLSELFGAEQVADFPRRYQVDRDDYLRSLGESRHLSSGDLDRVAQFVQGAARTLEHAGRRMEQRGRRVRRLRARVCRLEEEVRAFHALAARILAARDVDEVLALALETAMTSLRARRGSILLADEGRGQVTAQVFRGEHAGVAGTLTRLQEDSVSHRVFYGRAPLLVQDAERELGAAGGRQFPYASRSFLSVPLREDGHSLGVLHVTEGEEGTFSPEDLAFLERLGVHASAAISRFSLEREARALHARADADPATGVHSRRFLEESLAVALERARRFDEPLAVILVSGGAGEPGLPELAAAVRRAVRSVDLLGRHGGDELLLLLPGTTLAGALGAARKIRASVEEAGGPAVRLGVAAYPELARSSEELLLAARQSLLAPS